MCSFTALGLTEHEASGTRSLLNSHDVALMKAVVERRREGTMLAGAYLGGGLPIKVTGRRAAAVATPATMVAILARRTALPSAVARGEHI